MRFQVLRKMEMAFANSLSFCETINRNLVAGAQGSVRLYHYARGKDPQTVDLKETEPGTYVATVQMARDGRWQFDLTLDRDKQHFEWNQAQELQLP